VGLTLECRLANGRWRDSPSPLAGLMLDRHPYKAKQPSSSQIFDKNGELKIQG